MLQIADPIEYARREEPMIIWKSIAGPRLVRERSKQLREGPRLVRVRAAVQRSFCYLKVTLRHPSSRTLLAEVGIVVTNALGQ
jgi:hypothetical protein